MRTQTAPIRVVPLIRICALFLIVAGPLGCGFAHVNEDSAKRPERAIGTGGTIMMPGDSPPPLSTYDPYEQHGPPQSGGAPSQAQTAGPNSSSGNSSGPSGGSYGGGGTRSSNSGPGSSSGSSSGSAQDPRDPEMTMIGGASGELDSEYTLRDMPLGPLAILFGYPYWVFGKTIHEEADQAAEERSLPDAEPKLPERPSHPQDVAQRSRTERENADIAEQLRNQPAPRIEAERASNSIHDELAALERSLGNHVASATTDSGPRRGVDRNADGRTDLWTKTAADGSRREALDENQDGRVDRILSYDPEHRLVRAEEDRDGDGRLETISQFEGGQISRRHSDDDGDGRPDSWSFFSGGELVRHEVDRDADGVKDLSMVYTSGELIREEEDRNADGRPDLISHYRNGEVVERAEDTDFDGRTDLRSFYERGRLVRREVS